MLERIRKVARVFGAAFNRLLHGRMQSATGRVDPESSIEEFRWLSDKGKAVGWHFQRDELHDRS